MFQADSGTKRKHKEEMTAFNVTKPTSHAVTKKQKLTFKQSITLSLTKELEIQVKVSSHFPLNIKFDHVFSWTQMTNLCSIYFTLIIKEKPTA